MELAIPLFENSEPLFRQVSGVTRLFRWNAYYELALAEDT